MRYPTQTIPRRRTAPLLLTVAALVAAASAASAENAAQVAHSEGYPRTSDAPPAAIEGDTSGYGEHDEEGDGEAYDTNWFIDADEGDSDVVLLQVHGASIAGYGYVADADISSETHRTKSAWGEDRLRISAPADAGERVELHVMNRIRIVGSWILDGNGWNSAALFAQALDIDGNVHTCRRTLHVDPTLSGTTTTSGSGSVSGSNQVTGSVQGDSVSSTGSTSSSGSASGSTTSSESVSSGSAISDDVDLHWEIRRTVPGASCEVRIASTEMMDISSRAMVDGRETTTRIPDFDTINLVSATYVIDPPPPDEGGGPGTPGGEGSDPPATKGGDGTGPETPGTPPGGGENDPGPRPDDGPVLPPAPDPLPPPTGG